MRSMRRIQIGLITACAAACLAPATLAQTDLGDNAALRYWRAFALFQDDKSFEDAWTGMAAAAAEDSRNFSARYRKIVENRSQSIDALLRGAQFDGCDFGIEYNDGPRALLPHLGAMRRGARLLLADSRLHAEDGDIDGAVDRAVAAMRMAEHATQDDVLISSLVGRAITGEVHDYLGWFESRADLTDAHRTAMLGAISEFDVADAFQIRSSLKFEIVFIDWVRDYVRKGDNAALLQMLRDFEVDIPEESAIDFDAMPQYVELYEVAMSQLMDAWDKPDFEDRMLRVEGEIAQGSFGPLAQWMIPSLLNVKKQYDAGQQLIADMKAQFGG